MRLAAIAFALTSLLILTACADNDEDLPTPTITLAGDAVVICPQIGNAPTPPTPTAAPSCAAGSNLDVPPGIRGHVTLPPQYPEGAEPVTEYVELTETAGIGATIALPIHWPAPTNAAAFWYTFADGSWSRLQVADLADNREQTLVSGRFDPLPPNLIVLAERQ